MMRPSRSVRVARSSARQLEGDFFALNGYIIRRVDPDPHRIPVDFDDGDADFLADVKTLAELPAQD
jgi:hypothetical protein